MQNKMALFKNKHWNELSNKDLCDLGLAFGIELKGIAEEKENGKYILKDRSLLIEKLSKRWIETLYEESIFISKLALGVSMISALITIISIIINYYI